MLACFPYGGMQRKEITPWAMQAAVWASKQRDIAGGLKYWDQNDTPITMCRNLAVQAALDLLVLLLAGGGHAYPLGHLVVALGHLDEHVGALQRQQTTQESISI